MNVDLLIDKLVGKPFEIECSEIRVHGMLDHAPPLYAGPGVIKADSNGQINFRMHSRSEPSQAALSSLRWFGPDGKLEPASDVRIFADDYDGLAWIGGWSIPKTVRTHNSKSIISGSFNQLSTFLPESKRLGRPADVTELIYGKKIDLPATQATESLRVHEGRILRRHVSFDRHELDFKGALITFAQDNEKNRTHIIAEKRQGFNPPLVENWIADAVTFVTARLIYPRMVIRHFGKAATVFVRAYPADDRTGMPAPVQAWHPEWWNLFTCFLAKCEETQQFESNDLTRLFHEVIMASTGTVQAFVLSMALCIENLLQQVAQGEVIDKSGLKALKDYVSNWPGWAENEGSKNRTDGLLGTLRTIPASNALAPLIAEGTIQSEQAKAWKEIRPMLAHGTIIKNPFDPVFWESRHLLIEMTYNLIFRSIGYPHRFSGPGKPTLLADVTDESGGESGPT